MLTEQEKQLMLQYNQAQALLAPFKRITESWGVQTTHKFQERIRSLDLVASGDLEGDWSIKILAHNTGVIVAEFTFPEYGRLFDMRKVDYTKPIPPEALIPWVESKVDKGQIRYSTLAEKNNLLLTDPKVIHDLAWRFARAGKFNISRKRWYNKGKESSLGDLYEQLQEAMSDAVVAAAHADIRLTPQNRFQPVAA